MRRLIDDKGQFRVTLPKKFVKKLRWEGRMDINIEDIEVDGEIGFFVSKHRQIKTFNEQEIESILSHFKKHKIRPRRKVKTEKTE